MERFVIIILSIFYSCLTSAGAPYQVDLIIFAHSNPIRKFTLDDPFIPWSTNAIPLQPRSESPGSPYHVLPASHSSLRNEYYLLTRQGHYQVLGHYSWVQPANNKAQVALPFVDQKGWKIQGYLGVKQSNYYFFNAKLQVAPPDHPQESFIVLQKQRLKENVVYYLDHAQIGILVKIHHVT